MRSSISNTIHSFSKLTKEQKIEWLVANYLENKKDTTNLLKSYWHTDLSKQELHDGFSENSISNFYLPFGIAPNFVVNKKTYAIPMVTEESSVVASASKTAKFWSSRGGFKASVLSTQKIGQVHFMYNGKHEDLVQYFISKKEELIRCTDDITKNMRSRGGGITEIELIDNTKKLENYFQLHVSFETVDSMGANFINSCLEQIAKTFASSDIKIVMSILSNHVPNCIARAEVCCRAEDLYKENSIFYAEKFIQAVKIAQVNTYRAVTHNKGIMNGVDAVVIATGNDFRSVEASAHAYASKDGCYKSLSDATIEHGVFKFWLEIPLAIGTVGGLTSLHPLSKISLDILGNPNAKELMQIIAAAGLAQNFAAIRALTTTGIQKGHMKLHLSNIIKSFGANSDHEKMLTKYFENKTISHSEVAKVYEELLNNN
jgi:hydroxymethylglutaryl-CoA reductase